MYVIQGRAEMAFAIPRIPDTDLSVCPCGLWPLPDRREPAAELGQIPHRAYRIAGIDYALSKESLKTEVQQYSLLLVSQSKMRH